MAEGGMLVIVVDDEPLARRGIIARLRRHPDVRVAAECADARQAAAAIRALRPTAVFLDVEMPGVSGLELMALLGERELPFIILVTAHEQHALAAFDLPALDYLLKPIDDARFDRAIERLRRARASAPGAAIGVVDLLTVPHAGGRDVIPLDSITWIEADGDHVRLHGAESVRRVRSTLRAMMDRLPAQSFRQVHRSAAVRVAAIARLTPLPNREYVIVLLDGTQLRLSRTYRDALRELLPP